MPDPNRDSNWFRNKYSPEHCNIQKYKNKGRRSTVQLTSPTNHKPFVFPFQDMTLSGTDDEFPELPKRKANEKMKIKGEEKSSNN
eukprot:UN26749